MARTLSLKLDPISSTLNYEELSKKLDALPGVSKVETNPSSNALTLHTSENFDTPSAICKIAESTDVALKLEGGKLYGVGDMGCGGCSGMVKGEFEKVSKDVVVDLDTKIAVMGKVEKDEKSVDDVVEIVRKKGKRVMEWNSANGVYLDVVRNGGEKGMDEEGLKKIAEEVKNVEKCRLIQGNEGAKTVLKCEGILDLNALKEVMAKNNVQIGLHSAVSA